MNEFKTRRLNSTERLIRAQVARETRCSKFRDHCSGKRVHPLNHDIGSLLDFAVDHRRRQGPVVRDAARLVLTKVDPAAVRVLVDATLNHGRCDVAMRRRCDRLLAHCDNLDAAIVLLHEWMRTHPRAN